MQICMIEGKRILIQLATDKHKVINDNSDIYSSCKYGGQFHKYFHIVSIEASMQKKSQVIYEAETPEG